MDIFGIGPLEFFFVILIALLVLGPRDMVKAGRTLGRILRNIVQSDTWRAVLAISKDMRNLPTRLMREANLEDEVKALQVETEQIRRQLDMSQVEKDIARARAELEKESSDALADWTTPPEAETPSIRPPQIPAGEPASEWTQPPSDQPAEVTAEKSAAAEDETRPSDSE